MRTLVVVSGPSGAGKSTLTRDLAARLRIPVLAKDVIKEALFDTLGTGDQEWSDRLSGSSYETMFRLAAHMDEVLLEANFKPYHAERLLSLCPDPVEVHCWCPPDELERRRARRRRHPGHLDHVGEPPDDPLHALGLTPEVLEVDTSGHVDVDDVARWVEERRRA